MTPEAAYSSSRSGELLLIDVRRPTEWEKTGIAETAVPLTMHGENGVAGLIQSLESLVAGDKSKPIAVICRSGTRSARVSKALLDHGFTQVHDVSEGMIGNFVKRGWIKRGLPTKPTTKDDEPKS